MNKTSIDSFNLLLLNNSDYKQFGIQYDINKYIELFISHFNLTLDNILNTHLKNIEITNIFKLDVENIFKTFGIKKKFNWFIKKYDFKEGIDFLKYKIHNYKILGITFYNNIYVVNTKTVMKCICFYEHNKYFNYYIYLSYIINAYSQYQYLVLRKSINENNK